MGKERVEKGRGSKGKGRRMKGKEGARLVRLGGRLLKRMDTPGRSSSSVR